jgi:2-oxoglutarate dehydrogenase E2 component (dihydrolipoamide succinyltransferase)
MQVELKVPSMGESITEVEIGSWLKAEGDAVSKDENVVVIDSEKTTLELAAPVSGSLAKILRKKGETAKVGEVIGYVEQDGAATKPAATAPEQPKPEATPRSEPAKPAPEAAAKVMPAAARVIAEHGLKAEAIQGSGPGGRILKEDALKQVEQAPKEKAAPPPPAEQKAVEMTSAIRQEQIVPMTRLRKTLAERLVQAQHTAALLTTFNEVDMSEVMNLRKQYQESFVQKYGVKLGFMSFFVKAVIDALRLIPQVNAEIRGTDIVFRNYYDIGVAVGGGKGLVVPVLRNAERMSFAQVEVMINDLGKRAKENKLKLEELQGGTFTISNGGVYGSLLSTPIINPPQSGILGMHAIQERPVAREGQVVIRPMMYIALTYDHRIVDGREAVTFLKRVKEVIENPTRILLEV